MPRLLRSRRLALLAATAVVAAIGALDNRTGTEIRVYPLYIVPIALATATSGLRAGLLISTLAVVVWLTSKLSAGLTLPAGVWAINALAHITAFSTITWLIASLRRSRADEAHLARTDPLTGLANPRSFGEAAAAEIERQRRYGHPLTLAFFDLDNFKAVNDRLGHRAGDEVLVTVARTLRAVVRASDVLGRLGGDELALLMPETDAVGARALLERARAALAAAMAGARVPVTASIGAVAFAAPPASVDQLIGEADALMYEVKRGGKDAVRVEVYSSSASQTSPSDDSRTK